MEWRNMYRGLLMGVSDIVPGVSGGTIAVLLGIYDDLIAAINGVFTKEWKRHVMFLIPLGVGMIAAIFSFSHLMKWLLANHAGPTYFLFIGLILGILPFLFKESQATTTFKWYHFVIILLGIALMTQISPPGNESLITERTFSTYIFLFFSGFVASAAMVLPGISGSLILMIIGSYETAITAVKELELSVILIVGIGVFIGIITMSKIIHYFLKHYRTATFSLLIGFVIGSIYVIYTAYLMYSGWTDSFGAIIASVILFMIGLFVAVVLGKVEY